MPIVFIGLTIGSAMILVHTTTTTSNFKLMSPFIGNVFTMTNETDFNIISWESYKRINELYSASFSFLFQKAKRSE